MKIDKCENDFYGNSCSSGICFYPNTTGCIQTDLTLVLLVSLIIIKLKNKLWKLFNL